MLKTRFCFLTILCFYFQLQAKAQDNLNIKFGKLTPADFQIEAPKFDSGASAVIIATTGKIEFEGNGKDFFDIVYTYFIRAKILNKNGFDVADFVYPLYNNREGDYEKITSLKGSTFNLQNGVIQETKLDEKSIFPQKRSKYFDEIKFSMPSLSAGSIFDIELVVKSPYFDNIPSWAFQKEYPCLWNEYQITIPTFFHYFRTLKGNAQFDIETTKDTYQTFSVRSSNGTETDDLVRVSSDSKIFRWVKKNVPAFKNQIYLSSTRNYVPRIEFDLNYFQLNSGSDRHMQLGTWTTKSQKLLSSKSFGVDLDEENRWMNETMKAILANTKTDEDQIKAIYNFVRNNFKCTDHDEKYIESPLKEVFERRTGNVAELNLLLVTMLRHQNIKADPALLSTRDNGVTAVDFPFLYQYNYVICIAQANDKTILLDASQPNNPYGLLPDYCYNWYARAINDKIPFSLVLSPDSLSEQKTTSVFLGDDEKGNYNGFVTTNFGNNESYNIREEIRKTSQKEYIKKQQTAGEDFVLSDYKFDSLSQPDIPLVAHYNLDVKDLKSKDIIYFNPVLGSGLETNPFTDAERMFPVEMTAKVDNTYLLNMSIPKGFKIDELPKSVRVSYNENEGMFEYLIQQTGENIQMRVHLKFNKATFSSDEYSSLREFYAYVVRKEGEQIVLKKM